MKIYSNLSHNELFDLLEELHNRYNRRSFIDDDPISIPHRYSVKKDIEIAGFFSAILAWGQRSQIVKNAGLLMDLMDNVPADFIINSEKSDIARLRKFYYRTFQFSDLEFFVWVLKEIYSKHGGLENLVAESYMDTGDLKNSLITIFNTFESIPHLPRSLKHIANIAKGSSAKRLNMFLRWMVRNDNRGVDFGIWKSIPASALYIPLDVHSGRVAREFNLLTRLQNDWKSVEELTSKLRIFDPSDPVKYDFALFGAGVDKTFI
jgi:uncharacterized protein (TIGR02757 family)